MPRGGARAGAGRKIKGGGESLRKTYSFSLLPALVTVLDEAARAHGISSRSEALEQVLNRVDLALLLGGESDAHGPP